MQIMNVYFDYFRKLLEKIYRLQFTFKNSGTKNHLYSLSYIQ
jgi:hypothetical protein